MNPRNWQAKILLFLRCKQYPELAFLRKLAPAILLYLSHQQLLLLSKDIELINEIETGSETGSIDQVRILELLIEKKILNHKYDKINLGSGNPVTPGEIIYGRDR